MAGGSSFRVRAGETGCDRVCVLLSLLGHEVEISLPAEQLLGRAGLPQSVPAALRTLGASAAPAAV